MSQAYPISIEHFITLLEALEPLSQQIATLRKFLKNRIPAGFPVKLGMTCARSGRALGACAGLQLTLPPHTLPCPRPSPFSASFSEIPVFPTVSVRVTFTKYQRGADETRFCVPSEYTEVTEEELKS